MKQKIEEMKELLEQRLLKKLDYSRESTDEEVKELIDNLFLQEEALRTWKVEERQQLKQDIFCALRRLDILQVLLEDNSITEVMINGPNDIFVEQAGKIKKLPEHFESREKLLNIIQKIVADCNRSVNEASPIVDARLKDGSRVNVVLNPVAINGPIVTIRRFPDKPVTMEQMLSWHSITKEAAEELKTLVQAGYNIFISGGTGSGKTTFLNVLSGFIPSDERVITIEDSAELQLQGIPNLVRMETRNENVEGCHSIAIRDLIKSSLRMRPD
ncbi:MAG: CpaF family protein, partial [Lachnospiraceae bacterium]